jgi:hypothetical protein
VSAATQRKTLGGFPEMQVAWRQSDPLNAWGTEPRWRSSADTGGWLSCCVASPPNRPLQPTSGAGQAGYLKIGPPRLNGRTFGGQSQRQIDNPREQVSLLFCRAALSLSDRLSGGRR